MAAEQLVDRDAQRIVIRLCEEQVVVGLRGRVVRRHARPRHEDGAALLAHRADAEVDDGDMAPVIAEHDVRWLEVFVDDVVTVEDLEALIQGRYDLLLQLGEREPPPLQASRRVVRDDLKREALPGPRLKQPRHIRRVDAAQCRDNGILDGRRPAVDLGDVLFATIGADVERGLARGRRQQAFHSVLIEQHRACRQKCKNTLFHIWFSPCQIKNFVFIRRGTFSIFHSPLSILNYCYLFSSANFFMKSMSFSTPSIGIAL